ncbi:MAG: hypothetical protein OXI92_16485, partial [Acidobacteriota bacterium]|nr:hypothetical protein [Acidobacteriota bacterium]
MAGLRVTAPFGRNGLAASEPAATQKAWASFGRQNPDLISIEEDMGMADSGVDDKVKQIIVEQ